jgi:hypothetical protein
MSMGSVEGHRDCPNAGRSADVPHDRAHQTVRIYNCFGKAEPLAFGSQVDGNDRFS